MTRKQLKKSRPSGRPTAKDEAPDLRTPSGRPLKF